MNGTVFDLPTTMPKFLPLGLGLDDILMKTATVPARVLGLADQLGVLADLAVFRLPEGGFEQEYRKALMRNRDPPGRLGNS